MPYKYIYEFWSFWFDTAEYAIPEHWISLLSLISCLALVWFCIVRPIIKLFR